VVTSQIVPGQGDEEPAGVAGEWLIEPRDWIPSARVENGKGKLVILNVQQGQWSSPRVLNCNVDA
jgi:hypothetical protein